MKKYFGPAALAGALILTGCNQQEAKWDESKLQYAQDSRTGLCYAFYGTSFTSIISAGAAFGITVVPCTEKVMALIPNN